jgi:DNA-binding GntR family transcriptional regulator
MSTENTGTGHGTTVPELTDNGLVEMASHRVCRLLRERIHSGDLAPGTRLVRRVLAKQMNVSPLPVLEAIYQLVQDGLVEALPMAGARVRPLTTDRILNDLMLREALDSQVARILATKLTAADHAGLYAAADEVDRLMAQPEPRSHAGMEAHARFHLQLAQLTGYALLVAETRRVWSRLFMLYAWVAMELVPPPANWHRQLVTALASGDVRVADEAARGHVRRTPAEQGHSLDELHRALARLAQPEETADAAAVP